MLEQIILGVIQGIAEWLPVSSEGLIILIKTNFFNGTGDLEAVIHQALFLHFGTCMAALFYFRRDIVKLMKAAFEYGSQPENAQKLLLFLVVSTVVSGVLGFGLIKALSKLAGQLSAQGKIITLAIGCLLLVTAYCELKANKSGYRNLQDLKWTDSILLGIVQGFATLPGLSRSGLTVSALLLRKIDRTYALKLSFLMSIPIVFIGNIILNFNTFVWSAESAAGLLCSFVFGLTTIHVLLKLAEKINFGFFVLLFGALTILSTLI